MTSAKIFSRSVDTFDSGLLQAYSAVNVTAIYSRQCVVQDVHYLRTEVAKLHLSLPQGYCPKLVQFAQGLSMA